MCVDVFVPLASYSCKRQRRARKTMPLRDKSIVRYSVKLFLTTLLIIGAVLLSFLGGFLNRCRGGYVDLHNVTTYWPAHIISRQFFSFPTGLLVLLLGLNLRAAIVVWLLTQWTLFVGWGAYFNIGSAPSNYMSREGVFDWLLGRQQQDWNFTERFVRDYSGMALRGLVWTAPQGYALQQLGFGWQYSLCGSMMSAVYYLGTQIHLNTTNRFFDGHIGYSEFMWGTWVWFILIVICLTQLVHRIRGWVYAHSSTPSVSNPDTRWEKFKFESLNYTLTQVVYDLFFVLLWFVFAASVVFYSLIIQPDLRNKGQTFFGMLMAIITLLAFMSFRWGAMFHQWQLKREKRSAQRLSNIPVRNHTPSRSYSHTIDRLEAGHPNETDPLLPWPYSHPDKIYIERRKSPVMMRESSRVSTPSEVSPITTHSSHYSSHQPSSIQLAFLLIWPGIERWLYLDVFAWLRHAIGFLTACSICVTIFVTVMGAVWGSGSSRWDPYYHVCTTTTNITDLSTYDYEW